VTALLEGSILRRIRTSAFRKFLKWGMKILIGDYIAKVGKEDISKPTVRNESLYEISNDTELE
jgi:hypothetical protein